MNNSDDDANRKDSTGSKKLVSPWEEVMRKFSESHKVECRTKSIELPKVKAAKQFPTGSHYDGTWDVLGMAGRGVYTFPNGVIYEGEFNDSMFHGDGELRYPSGIKLKGKWHQGQMIEREMIFADGLPYKEIDWEYCKMPDRRYSVEIKRGLQPSGRSYMTAVQPEPFIPDGYFDTGDGLYDPKTKAVFQYDDLNSMIRSPSFQEQKWIVDNCRTSPDYNVGPIREFYEKWTPPNIYSKSDSLKSTKSVRTKVVIPQKETKNGEADKCTCENICEPRPEETKTRESERRQETEANYGGDEDICRCPDPLPEDLLNQEGICTCLEPTLVYPKPKELIIEEVDLRCRCNEPDTGDTKFMGNNYEQEMCKYEETLQCDCPNTKKTKTPAIANKDICLCGPQQPKDVKTQEDICRCHEPTVGHPKSKELVIKDVDMRCRCNELAHGDTKSMGNNYEQEMCKCEESLQCDCPNTKGKNYEQEMCKCEESLQCDCPNTKGNNYEQEMCKCEETLQCDCPNTKKRITPEIKYEDICLCGPPQLKDYGNTHQPETTKLLTYIHSIQRFKNEKGLID